MKNKKLHKEVREWLVLIVVGSVLYFTGWYVEVGAFLQRGILQLGLMQPEQIEKSDRNQMTYDFELTDINGQTVKFSEFRGKTVLINIWATWCPPCKAEMPNLESLFQKTNEQVEFVMIARDDDFQKAIDYVHKRGFSFPVYKLTNRIPDEIRTNSIPATFVISPNGEIAAKRIGMAKYDTAGFRDFLLSL